jgi:conjugative transfer region protein (TIGR03750 family)
MQGYAVNHKLAIYKACTWEELLVIFAALFIGAVLFFGIACKVVFGSFLLGVVLAMVGVLVMLRPSVGFVSRMKRGKPKGYFRHWGYWQWQRLGWGKKRYFDYRGSLSVGRYER